MSSPFWFNTMAECEWACELTRANEDLSDPQKKCQKSKVHIDSTPTPLSSHKGLTVSSDMADHNVKRDEWGASLTVCRQRLAHFTLGDSLGIWQNLKFNLPTC